MGKFTVNNLKSLANTISGVVDQVEQKDVSTAFANSLTEKALQLNEEKHEKEESPAEEKAEMLMKRLAAKALKRARKKAGKSSTDDQYAGSKPKAGKSDPDMKNARHASAIAEMAAPGYEDWASDPKVKASFKKQYGKDWKQVMYGRSWNMKKMDEEIELAEGVKRMRRLRSAYARGRGSRKLTDTYDKELSKVSASRLRRGGASKQTVRGFFTDKPTTAAADKAYSKFSKDAMAKASAKGKKVFESEQLDEISDTLLFRARAKAKGVGKFKVRTNPSFAGSSKDVPLHKKITKELQRRGSVPVSESEQLDEAGYKKLMRIKGAAYKAELASRGADPNTSLQGLVKAAKLKRAAAEREAQVAAGMARRGGASQEAVRGGGSRIGKSGKYTKKAGKLANQRDKALASFRTKGRIAQLLDKREDQSRKKRERQQAQAKFNMDARHGYFGHEIAPEIAKAGMRARYNYEKKYGRLKGK